MSVFYRLVRFIFRNYNQLYFRRFRVVGKENIPNEGSNLVFAKSSKCTARPVIGRNYCWEIDSFPTRSDVFGGPLQWFLDAMQTLPIYRIRDGYDQLKNNQVVFEQCYALLGDKKHMMMFSEGRHHGEYYFLPVKREFSSSHRSPVKTSPSSHLLATCGIELWEPPPCPKRLCCGVWKTD